MIAQNSKWLSFTPIQKTDVPKELPAEVTLRAYEVYCEVWGPQPALVEGWCRGGFGAGELIAFLYARSFPKEEWKQRFREACREKPRGA